MANILDIFRTHTGKILLQKTGELISAEEKSTRQGFTFLLPALLAILQNRSDLSLNLKDPDLISYIENAGLIDSGNQFLEKNLEDKQLKNLRNCHIFTDLNSEQFGNILSISTGVLASILGQIQQENGNVKFSEIIETLAGYKTKYEKAFIKTLIKNEEDPNLIESSEEIALDHKKDDDDQSILGGYAGGR